MNKSLNSKYLSKSSKGIAESDLVFRLQKR